MFTCTTSATRGSAPSSDRKMGTDRLGWYRTTCSSVVWRYSGRLEHTTSNTVSRPSNTFTSCVPRRLSATNAVDAGEGGASKAVRTDLVSARGAGDTTDMVDAAAGTGADAAMRPVPVACAAPSLMTPLPLPWRRW